MDYVEFRPGPYMLHVGMTMLFVCIVMFPTFFIGKGQLEFEPIFIIAWLIIGGIVGFMKFTWIARYAE